MKIDLNKKYRYRCGKTARVICVDTPGAYPVISVDEKGQIVKHSSNGSIESDTTTQQYNFDLIEVREPLECWVMVDDHGQIVTSEGVRLCPLGSTRLFREVIE